MFLQQQGNDAQPLACKGCAGQLELLDEADGYSENGLTGTVFNPSGKIRIPGRDKMDKIRNFDRIDRINFTQRHEGHKAILPIKWFSPSRTANK